MEKYSAEFFEKQMTKKKNLSDKVLKQIFKFNPELKQKWPGFTTTSSNHYLEFFEDIVDCIQKKKIKLESIGQLIAKDNGSRGTQRSHEMILLDLEGNLLLARPVFQNKYYYL